MIDDQDPWAEFKPVGGQALPSAGQQVRDPWAEFNPVSSRPATRPAPPLVPLTPPRQPAPQTPTQAALDEQRLANDKADAEAKRRKMADDELERMYGKPPPGFRYKPDPREGVEPIPGGPDDPKRKETADALAQRRAELLNVVRKAQLAKQLAQEGWMATGFGSGTMASIGGTKAKDLAATLDTIKGNIAFTNLQQMRQNSPTGGAIGNVTDADMRLLQSTIASLDQSQSGEQFSRSLDDVIDHYGDIYRRIGGDERALNEAKGMLPGVSDGRGADAMPGPALGSGGGSNGGQQAAAGPRPYEGRAEITTGAMQFATDTDRRYAAVLQSILDRGGTFADAMAVAREYGNAPTGEALAKFRQAWNEALKWNKRNGNSGWGKAKVSIPQSGRRDTTTTEKIVGSIASNPVGASIVGYANGSVPFDDELYGAADSLLTGKPMDQAIAEADFKKGLIRDTNPLAFGIGQVAGGVSTMLATGGVAGVGRGAAALAPRALALDAGYGAVFGAGENNQDRLGGALAGGALGAAGGALGRTIGERVVGPTVNAVARRLGGGAAPVPASERLLARSIDRSPDATAALREAESLGVPMTLSDASPSLNSLAGAVARRSPEAGGMAREVFGGRSRDQVVRFNSALERDLGPLENVPQLSDDLSQKAKASAAPYYEEAYRAPVISTPEIESLLNTDFGRQAVARAAEIARNERRPLRELGIALDERGNPVMNPQPFDAIAMRADAQAAVDEAQAAYRAAKKQRGANAEPLRAKLLAARARLRAADRALAGAADPSAPASVMGYTVQSLDYIKRGMDDVLEQYRNEFTNRLELKDLGRSQLAVKNKLLAELDRLNPAYAEGRLRYSGPVQARDSMFRGQDMLGADARRIAMQIAQEPEELLPQVQLGYRDALAQKGSKLSYGRNPFELLNSPNIESGLSAVYANNPGVGRLLRQSQIERDLAASQQRVVGNSMTAERGIADEAFASDVAGRFINAGVDTAITGAPIRTIGDVIARYAKDRAKLGLGRAAQRRADELAPILFDTDIGRTLGTVYDVMARRQAYDTAARRFNRIGGASASPLVLAYAQGE